MEGISGVVNWPQVESNNLEYQRFRRIMTEDVKAAVRGARRGGSEGDGPCGGYHSIAGKDGS
jgi:D-amino peptidase